jgi:hypothetical protein
LCVWVFAEQDSAVFAPVFVYGDEFPGDGWGEGLEYSFVRWVDVEGGRDAVEERVLCGELDAGEIAAAGNFSGAVEHADAGPVVERLQRQVEVVVGFEFEDGEAAVAGDGDEVEHGAGG